MDIVFVPILLLFISIVLLIFTVFWIFYYNTNNWVIILFSIGILLGLIACIILIYLRWPTGVPQTKMNDIVQNDVVITNDQRLVYYDKQPDYVKKFDDRRLFNNNVKQVGDDIIQPTDNFWDDY